MSQNPFDPNAQPVDPNNPAVPGPGPTPGTGVVAPATPAAPAVPAGGYDLEKFRKAWYGQGDVNNIQGWLDKNKDFTTGVTLKNEKAYDPSGRFIADLVGNYNQPGQTRTAIFLDGIGSNGKPRTSTPTKPKPYDPANPGIGPGRPGTPPAGSVPKPKPATTPVVPTQTPTQTPTQPTVPGQSIAPVRDPRLDAFFGTLMDRAKQGLNVDRNDPVIRQQADAFSANQDRSRRDYLADLAESSGPNANLRNETRMSAEKAGQASGAFEGQLMARELQSRREEIATALASGQNLLTFEQQAALQKELAVMDNTIQRMGLAQADKHFGLDLGYRNKALAQNNSQFNQSQAQQNNQFNQNQAYQYAALSQADKQFLDQLGLNYSGQSNYWDWMNKNGGQ